MSDETKGVDWETMDWLEANATRGPWFASDWNKDDGPMETTVEAHEPDRMGIYPGGIAKLKVADTDGGEKPLEDSAFIAQFRSEYPAIRAEMRVKDAEIERLTGLGSPAERFGMLLMQLHNILPDEVDPLSSEPPEPKYIIAIQGLKDATAIMRAMLKDKDERMKRLEAEATLLRIDMGNVAELRAALTETYNAAMWLASDETGREVPKWVYDAIEAAQKLAVAK